MMFCRSRARSEALAGGASDKRRHALAIHLLGLKANNKRGSEGDSTSKWNVLQGHHERSRRRAYQGAR